ncbi:hypothetical protein DAPPUDRAFT_328415 [Daphnia pulex]|uniref:IPO4/5-like TPR repeats domain-containing protein n=1 Tax=Daphnia pulex TaxID=6669 RepID=E9HDL8_DAPPU|nr:hypothetical protein DAPPUDRAFT_328415 [Daphnia pulex]|eukprot:EFX70167.1 hypothetical protein DAPPUDRAFT_328415 [Daphnia pulex]
MAENEHNYKRFLHLLGVLFHNDNHVRSAVKVYIDAFPIKTRSFYLWNTIRNSALEENLQQMATDLLCELITEKFEDFYNKHPTDYRHYWKTMFLNGLKFEVVEGIRSKIGHVSITFARKLMSAEGICLWPEFLNFIFESASNGTPTFQISSLQMFGSFPGMLGNQQSQKEEIIKKFLKDCLAASSNYSVRFQAAKTFSSYVLHNRNDVVMHRHFQELIAGVIQIVAKSIQKQEDQSLLKCVLDMVLVTPALFRLKINILLKKCTQAVDNGSLQDSWRQLVLEVIVTIAETAPENFLEEGITLFPIVIPTILTMMTELDDDESVVNVNSKKAEIALVRLARGIGSASVYPHLIQRLPVMLTHTDWRVRHAGITAICAVGECCRNEMIPLLNGILEHILHFLRDEEPAVRLAACSGVVKMLKDFYPSLHLNNHQQIIPKLLTVMDDVNGRVQEEGTYAVIIFCEKCPKTIIKLYGNLITGKLEELGFAWALNKIRSLIGQIAGCVPQSAILQSKNVELIRKNDPKYYKQRLFGFLSQSVGTSCTIKCEKKDGRYRATLTVYGEGEPVVGVHDHRVDAEIQACIKYINP